MNKLFPKTIDTLCGIEGFQGAIIFNFRTGEILDYAEFGEIDLRPVVETSAQMVYDYIHLSRKLALADVVERFLISTNFHYHILYLVPQFDTVAVYLIVNRFSMLPTVTQILEDAVYAMH